MTCQRYVFRLHLLVTFPLLLLSQTQLSMGCLGTKKVVLNTKKEMMKKNCPTITVSLLSTPLPLSKIVHTILIFSYVSSYY